MKGAVEKKILGSSQADLNFISGPTSCVTLSQQPNLSEPQVPGKVVQRAWGGDAGTVVGKQ